MKKLGFAIFAFILMFLFACKSNGSQVNKSSDNEIDLRAFYNLESEKYGFPQMAELSADEINTYYEGLKIEELDECLIYSLKANENTMEMALIKAHKAYYLEKIVSIIYSRKSKIEAAPQNNKSKCDIIVNDKYVLFIVNEHAIDIANDFNKLFGNVS